MQSYAGAAAVLLAATSIVVAAYAAHLAAGLSRSPLLVAPFLGGSAATEHAVSRYHARWYAMSMVFLAFDVEMLFMYPWTRVVASVGVSAVVEMFLFLVVLMAAVVYAWREGAFRWA